MLRRLGYVGISLSIEASSNSGTILRNATPERLRALIAANLDGLRRILEFNAERGVRLFRVSSQVIPFGGHPVNTVAWWDEYAPDLAHLAELARRPDMRLSQHPGQYTLLTSPDPAITENAFRDLAWHARLLDALGMGPEGKLVIHGGGAYGDKASALARWADRFQALPDAVRRRLVVENDERVYSVADLLPLCERTGVPLVVDTLHHRLNPGAAAMPLGEALVAAFATWRAVDGPPKLHFSSQALAKKPGAHSEYVDPDEFTAFLMHAPDQPFDVMLEAKAKDLAVFRLREELAARGHYELDSAPVVPAPV